jgi:CRP-like cAMP-binding protein
MDCQACTTDLPQLLARSEAARRTWATLPRRTLAAGDVLARTGEVARHVWHVERGLVRIYFLTADGLQRNRSFHAEGQWLGTALPYERRSSPYVIEALEASSVVCIALDDLHDWGARDPAVARMVESMAAWTFERQARREAELLTLDATERYAAFRADHAQIAARIPLHHVASYLGITNVALSRVRRRLRAVT